MKKGVESVRLGVRRWWSEFGDRSTAVGDHGALSGASSTDRCREVGAKIADTDACVHVRTHYDLFGDDPTARIPA